MLYPSTPQARRVFAPALLLDQSLKGPFDMNGSSHSKGAMGVDHVLEGKIETTQFLAISAVGWERRLMTSCILEMLILCNTS